MGVAVGEAVGVDVGAEVGVAVGEAVGVGVEAEVGAGEGGGTERGGGGDGAGKTVVPQLSDTSWKTKPNRLAICSSSPFIAFSTGIRSSAQGPLIVVVTVLPSTETTAIPSVKYESHSPIYI